MFIIRWFLSFVDYFGDFDCFCTKFVILWFNVEYVDVSTNRITFTHLITNIGWFGRCDDILSVSGVKVERVKTLDNLIDQSEQLGEKFNNDDVFNENFDKFCDVDQNHQKSPKTVKKVLCGCFVFWWFFDIIRWFSSFVENSVDFDCFCIKLVIFMVTSRKTME